MQPSELSALEFLTLLHEQGQKYSAINSARSALSALYSILGVNNFGSNSLISRFMKGIYESDTPMPRYKETWDVSVVLNYLKNLKENEFLSLPDLTLKLCALLALITAQRTQTLHSIRVSCIHKVDKGINIEIIDKIKNSKPGVETVLKLEPYHDKKLCVIETLENYLERTRKLRKGHDKLFLCYKSPFQASSKNTISRWIKTVMDRAGIDVSVFKPHSVRSASSSAMLREGTPLEKVLKRAGWSSASTFYRFYNRKIESNNLNSQNLILNYLR